MSSVHRPISPLRRTLSAFLGSLACVGCGQDAGVDTQSGSRWLVAERVRLAESGTALVRRLEPEDVFAIEGVSGAGEVVEVDAEGIGADRILVFGGGAAAHFLLEGPFEPGTVNALHLTAVFWSPARVTVHAMRDGDVVLSTRQQRVSADVRAQRIRVELRELEALPAVDAVAVNFGTESPSFGLESVELLRADRIDLLPARDGVGVEIRTDTRPAIGISNRVAAEVALPGFAGDRVAFDYGVPHRMNAGAGGVRLVATLEREGASVPLPNDEPSPGAWRTVEVRLPGDHEPGDRLRLALEADAEGEVVAAVGNFRIVGSGAPPAHGPATVVLVTSDTHRADHLGCAGQGVEVETPFLDALAARGVRYTDCWSLSNVTNPSHISIHSGIHPRDSKIVNNHTPLTRAVDTLADSFRAAGFHTYAAVSAPHLSDALSGLGQGFQRYDAPAEVRRASETLDRVRPWLDDAPEAPLFLWVHLFDAHGPYAPPEPFAGRYYPADANRYDPSLPRLGELETPRWDTEIRDLEWPRAQYRAEVSYLDRELARLFEHERLARAIVAVTSDHGEALGEAGVFFRHDGLSQSTLAVPLLLVAPGVPAGRVVEDGVHLGDLSRTLLDLAGLSSAPFPGRSLMAPEADRPRFAIQAHGMAASVRRGRWFLVLELEEQVHPALRAEVHEVHLFDLAEDPRCETDLKEREPERAAELRALLVRWLSEAPEGDLGAAGHRVEAETLDMLQELGYSDSGQRGPERSWIDPECACDECRRFTDD